jgi:hypothetical protein
MLVMASEFKSYRIAGSRSKFVRISRSEKQLQSQDFEGGGCIDIGGDLAGDFHWE